MTRGTVLAVAVAALAAAAPADGLAASGQATATGEARAEVAAPLVVTREADLDFGSIFAGSAAGAVTVSPGGVASYAGGVQPACAGGCGGVGAARFAVQGEGGRSYAVAVPAGVTAQGTATEAGAAAPPLDVTGLTVRSDSRPGAGAAGRLDGSGRDEFSVGGTLQVPAGLPAARYRATVPVIVTYG
ncbi:MAG: DUF4402 domain-containing protein [Sphingomonadales bacterium]|nr:DUF4402 domain-containing protein [Sphingomonadales bacterium]